MKSINKEELHSIFNGIASKNEIDFNKLYDKYSKLVYAILTHKKFYEKGNVEDGCRNVFIKFL